MNTAESQPINHADFTNKRQTEPGEFDARVIPRDVGETEAHKAQVIPVSPELEEMRKSAPQFGVKDKAIEIFRKIFGSFKK
jgi:hypothetical protein